MHSSVLQSSRILVVGTSAAGKSTLAEQLADTLDRPWIDLDPLYWDTDWTPKPAEQFVSLVLATASQPQWVISGNYGSVREHLWPHADVVVWLNYSFPTVLYRVLKRTFQRVFNREELWHGNRESFRMSFMSRDSIILWVITTYRRRRRQLAALRRENAYPHLSWIELRHPAQARELLAALRQAESVLS